MKTICFVNQKGGVGKTTSCLNIGAALHNAGKKVLLIDMDAQGSLTKSAGVMQLPADAPSVSEMLSGTKTAADILIRRDGTPDLLPSDIRLSGAEVSLIGAAGVSAVPMSARVAQKVGAEADPTNFLLMHAMGPNVAGVIGTAVAAGTFMAIFGIK